MTDKERLKHSMKRFFKDIISTCKIAGIKINLHDSAYVKIAEDAEAAGYFCGEDMELVAAIGGKNLEHALGTIVHEYCHLEQWAEDAKVWRTFEANDSMDTLHKYLEGKKISKKKARKAFDEVIALEADCERRTMEMIKLYDLPVNLKKYAKRAEKDLESYNVMFKTKKWA